MNPNWIRTTVASLLLAVLLRVGLGVPVFTTFTALAIIYVMHVVMTEMGTGVTTLWGWLKSVAGVGMGIAIFLALRFLAAKVLGLYPADTYGTLNDSGGLYWILVGHDVSSRILWEIMFAFVAGTITLDWVQGKTAKVRAIFVASLVVLSIQMALPKYTSTWPDKDTVSTTLVERGVLGTAWKGGLIFLFGKPASPAPTPTTVARPLTPATPVAECSTPCTINLGWNRHIKSDGRPILVKFYKKAEWIPLSGRGNDEFTLDQFNPGEAQFASPNGSTSVRVQIFPAR